MAKEIKTIMLMPKQSEVVNGVRISNETKEIRWVNIIVSDVSRKDK
jgi:hypothetical protein